jgi:SAM-dependent methyltransferase
MFAEMKISCGGIDDWARVAGQCAFLTDRNYIVNLANSIRVSGFVDPLHGWVRASDFVLVDDNYREGFVAHGLNSRYRAIFAEVLEYMFLYGRCSTIYLAEALSPFAKIMGKTFPYLVTSEHIANPSMRGRLSHVRHEDPTKLSLPDHAFDLYISSDVMVYSSSMVKYLYEARRILRRRGRLLATFPFRYREAQSNVLAEMIDGEIVHRAPPQFHSDPVDSSRRRLVFFVPGWDILDAAKVAGFESAEIMIHSSRSNAILGAKIAAVFVLKATA